MRRRGYNVWRGRVKVKTRENTGEEQRQWEGTVEGEGKCEDVERVSLSFVTSAKSLLA